MKNLKFFLKLTLFIILFGLNQTYARCVACRINIDYTVHCVVLLHTDCKDISILPKKNHTCMDFLIGVQKNPIIYYGKNKNAVVDDGSGSITNIASDKFEIFLRKNIKNKSIDLNEFDRLDDGIVSSRSIYDFAKEINAKIIYVDKLPKPNNCPICPLEQTPRKTGNGLEKNT